MFIFSYGKRGHKLRVNKGALGELITPINCREARRRAERAARNEAMRKPKKAGQFYEP